MRKNRYTILSLCILTVISIIFAPVSLAKGEIQLVESPPLEKSKIVLKESLFNNKILLANTQFDLRDRIDIEVKNQKSTQECWAFASTTALETNLLLTKNEKFDFSERHIVYSTARYFLDGQNPLGHNRTITSGGNSSLAMAYFTSGRGPILEQEMPFSETESNIYLYEINGKKVQRKVTDYIIFPSILKTIDEAGDINYINEENTVQYSLEQVEEIRNNIKQHIMNYGSVTAMTVSGSAYSNYYNYDLDYPAFYCDDTNLELNHQVSIIGWDDNYAVENFNIEHRPTKPGAYLVLNSYGTEGAFKNGCYYISYEDSFVEMGVTGIINAENIDYDTIYQYDPLGISSGIHIEGTQILYGANVFSKNKNILEQLNEISIASMVEENVEIYINPNDGDLTEEKLQKIDIDEKIIRQGYTTIKFKNPVKLTGGNFAIVVKYIGNDKDAYIGVESSSKSYWATATSNDGESFFSKDMKNWTDINTELKNTNICIKAFTTRIGYNITSDKYKIDEDIIYKIPLNTKVEEFKNNLGLTIDTKLIKDNNDLKSEDIITTGTQLVVDNSKTFTLCVTGDIVRN